MEGKKVSDSRVEIAQVMYPEHANPDGNVHGGHLLKLVDQAAAIVAVRHTHLNCVTASLDRMDFISPVYIGNLVQAGWKELARKYDLKINVSGIPPLSHWEIEANNSQLLHTIIVEKMLEKGFLSSKVFYATYTHTREQVDAYLGALDEILNELNPYIIANRVEELPHGSVAHSGFKRLT